MFEVHVKAAVVLFYLKARCSLIFETFCTRRVIGSGERARTTERGADLSARTGPPSRMRRYCFD